MGRLERIWVKRALRGPMDAFETVEVDAKGLVGNADRGGRRAITVLSAERWRQAEADLGVELDPSTRRANLLVSGVDLVESRGKELTVGGVRLKIGRECKPCRIMDEAHPGLQDALKADWGGGAYATVLDPGTIAVGDEVTLG
jgi:MOSC domain-containing protein YiiM